MSRIRMTRGLALGGCLATLSLASLISGCENASEPTRSDLASEPAVSQVGAPAVAQAIASPVSVALKTGFVRITSAIHPNARPELDAGRMDPEQRVSNMSLFFKLSPAQKKDRDALVAAQVDPKSPEYRHWLTPEDYAARFGARAEDIARASTWLAAQGFEVHRTSRLGTRVTFSGKVSDIESTFQTEMHHYLVRGETHYAMATPPAFPVDLADSVLALYNTNDFYAHPISGERIAKANAARRADPHFLASPDAGPDGGPLYLLGPNDWAAAYDVAKLYDPGIGNKKLDGTGVTIGIVGTAEIAESDINAFRTMFGIPTTTVTMTLVPDTGAAAAGKRGTGLEAILDTEWSGGVARGATINYVFVGANDRNVDDATFYLIEENIAPVMSESYGGCEAGNLPSDADVLEENGTAANLLGITYMASAGDSGAEDCGGGPEGSGLYVDMPGSFPGVTSVGGTQFPTPGWNSMGNLTGYPSLEQVWNEANDPYGQYGIGAGGGGISSVFARPDYQSSISTCVPVGSLPFTTSPSTMRQVPDVSLAAASETPGIFVECTFNAMGSDCAATGGTPEGTPIGGTSASSPSFAGIVAILNQAVGERLGNINPLLYALNAAQPTASPFHDITSGNNEIVCGTAAQGDAGGPGDAGWPSAGCAANGLFGFPATTGYDCASGIGSIDGFNLATALTGLSKTTTALVAAPNETTEGAEVTLTATVDTVGANANDLTGDVTFTFESYTTTGATDLSWELGTVALAGTGTTTATATLKTVIPPGLVKPTNQYVDVIAFYGGDTHHYPSQSPKVGVGFPSLSFAVDPATVTLAPDGTKTFTTTGGVPPIQWYIDSDTTRGRTDGGMFGAAEIDPMSGVLTVGPKAGYVEIVALDNDNAEALAYITVGSPDAGAPWSPDAGPFIDSGVPPLVDAAVKPKDAGVAKKDAEAPPKEDAGIVIKVKDAGHAEADAGIAAPGSSGCSCEVTGARSSSTTAPLGAFGGVLLGLGAIARRKRSRQ